MPRHNISIYIITLECFNEKILSCRSLLVLLETELLKNFYSFNLEILSRHSLFDVYILITKYNIVQILKVV